jgi:hypothetical protein
MARYGIAAVIASVYVIVAAWVVQSTGTAYRADLRRQRLAAGASSKATARAAGGDTGNGAGAKPSAVASASPPAAQLDRPVEATRTPAATSPKNATPGTAKGDASPVAPTEGRAAKEEGLPPAARDTVANARPSNPDPGFVWADSLDLAQLTIQDEMRLGRELNKLIMTYNRRLDDGAREQRVEDIARPLLNKRMRKEIEYTFTILDSEAVNAFSHPGGYIYVCRGLFNLFGEDEDYVLEFVLGHEIAHVDLKHALTCLQAANAEEKKRGLGTLPQFYLLIAFGYPDRMEFEADAWACKRMMVDLDRSRHDALAFLRKFEGYARDNGFSAGRKLPPQKAEGQTEAVPSLVENHYRAHTSARKRLGELKASAESLTFPPK